MNGEYEFDKLILETEREITNLKTAHKRPLGSLDFFSQTKSFNLTLPEQYGFHFLTFWFEVTVATPDVAPPIVQVGWDTPPGFLYIDLYESKVNSSYTVWSYKLNLASETISSTTFKATATSSLPIQSMTVRNA